MTTKRPDSFHIPVSISDLPGHEFSVTPDTLTEKVVEELENRPFLPGVMIAEKGRLFGVITRLKLFERLGHRFGVELFLQKPIVLLKDLIRTQSRPLQAHLRIDEAIQYALSRPAQDIYDPIVIQRDDATMQLLDINVLLLAQSRAMASLSNIVGNLEQIDRMIYAGRDRHETFGKILQLLRHVVPYHQAGILVADESGMIFAAHVGYRLAPHRADGVLRSEIYAIMLAHRQAVYIPAAHKIPAWQGMESLGMPTSWMGVPLLEEDRSFGLLSISRAVERPFSSEERETALAFAQRIVKLFKREKNDAGHNSQSSRQPGSPGQFPAPKLERRQSFQESSRWNGCLWPSLLSE
ncbi:MAG: GAF domain-containing protein [Chloroflexi bacterium]|nr:MAG: GAF domain-containing protein [Chloroflexota bacterium]